MMRSAMDRGKWVFFQNCHLSPSWMPSLERLIENIDPDKVTTASLLPCHPYLETTTHSYFMRPLKAEFIERVTRVY